MKKILFLACFLFSFPSFGMLLKHKKELVKLKKNYETEREKGTYKKTKLQARLKRLDNFEQKFGYHNSEIKTLQTAIQQSLTVLDLQEKFKLLSKHNKTTFKRQKLRHNNFQKLSAKIHKTIENNACEIEQKRMKTLVHKTDIARYKTQSTMLYTLLFSRNSFTKEQRIFLEKKMDFINTQEQFENGNTYMHIVCKKGLSSVAQSILKFDTAPSNDSSNTYSQFNVEQEKITPLLLQKNNNEKRPIDLAVENGQLNFLQIILPQYTAISEAEKKELYKKTTEKIALEQQIKREKERKIKEEKKQVKKLRHKTKKTKKTQSAPTPKMVQQPTPPKRHLTTKKLHTKLIKLFNKSNQKNFRNFITKEKNNPNLREALNKPCTCCKETFLSQAYKEKKLKTFKLLINIGANPHIEYQPYNKQTGRRSFQSTTVVRDAILSSDYATIRNVLSSRFFNPNAQWKHLYLLDFLTSSYARDFTFSYDLYKKILLKGAYKFSGTIYLGSKPINRLSHQTKQALDKGIMDVVPSFPHKWSEVKLFIYPSALKNEFNNALEEKTTDILASFLAKYKTHKALIKALINEKQASGLSKLMTLLQRGKIDFVKMLLQHGGDVNLSYYAKLHGVEREMNLISLLPYFATKELKEHIFKHCSINVNTKEMGNISLLDHATLFQDTILVKLLLLKGAYNFQGTIIVDSNYVTKLDEKTITKLKNNIYTVKLIANKDYPRKQKIILTLNNNI